MWKRSIVMTSEKGGELAGQRSLGESGGFVFRRSTRGSKEVGGLSKSEKKLSEGRGGGGKNLGFRSFPGYANLLGQRQPESKETLNYRGGTKKQREGKGRQSGLEHKGGSRPKSTNDYRRDWGNAKDPAIQRHQPARKIRP